MIERLKALFGEMKHDSEALFELRQLLFGLIIVAGITYGFHTLYVQTKVKEQKKLQAQERQIKANLGNGEVESLTAAQLSKLQKKEGELEDKIGFLRFKEEMFREEYTTGMNEHAFANVIFTLLPRSPVDIEGKLVKMNVLETRSFQYFEVLPVSISGAGHYSDLLAYLQYIEKRPEVGVIDSLEINLDEKSAFSKQVQVTYDLILGRIRLQ